MKTTLKMLCGAALLLMGGSTVNASVLDLRIGAGFSTANPKGFERRVNNLSGADLSAGSFDTYNADVVLHIPALPITLGLRYEQASQKKSAAAAEWELNVNNLAL